MGKHDQIEIVCEAEDSDAALAHLDDKNVDIILLDIEMPKRSGLEALPDIQAKANGARILVVSAFAEENGPAAIQALSLGACDTLAKPGRSGFSALRAATSAFTRSASAALVGPRLEPDELAAL